MATSYEAREGPMMTITGSFIRGVVGIAVSVAMLSGCIEPRNVIVTPGISPGSRTFTVPEHRSLPPHADKQTAEYGVPPNWQHVYVANMSGGRYTFGTVTVYAPGKGAPIRTISKGVATPFSLAFDGQGNLYVGDYGWVSVYARGTSRLLRKLNIGANNSAHWMTFDHAGYLYVANSNDPDEGGSVKIFQPHSSKLLFEIRKGVDAPWRVATSPAGYIYVTNYNGDLSQYPHFWVSVYAPRSRTPVRIIKRGMYGNYGLALDKSGNLYVGMLPGNGHPSAVAIYDRGSSKITRTITRDVSFPREFAFDASGNLYVDNCTNACGYQGWISVYPPGGAKPIRMITRGIYSPTGLALDSSGKIYVASWQINAVTVYAPDGDGPIETFRKGIATPSALAIGP
jgi:sugar lactone lactonase YvrE